MTTAGTQPSLGTSSPPPPPSTFRLAMSGLVAAAADVDPTTVATMAVLGATTVYGLSWLTLLVFPILAVVQTISSHVAVATRADLQTCVRRRWGRWVRWVLLASVLGTVAVTVAADLEGAAAAVGLLVGVDWRWFVIPVALAIFALIAFGSYDEVEHVLRYVMLCLLAYAVAAVVAHPHWGTVLRDSLVPRFRFEPDWTDGALALIGTTVTSYVYIWQTIEESEEEIPFEWVRARKRGAAIGVAFGVAITWFILICTGATLGTRGRVVSSAQDAAAALGPVAGAGARYLFAVALLGSALVALPVLLATAGYVVGADFDWERGLSSRVRHAPRFYAVVGLAVVVGVTVAMAGVSPIRVLFLAGIAGGVTTPIGLVLLLLVAGDRNLLEGRPVSRRLRAAGWLVTALITAATVAYFARLAIG